MNLYHSEQRSKEPQLVYPIQERELLYRWQGGPCLGLTALILHKKKITWTCKVRNSFPMLAMESLKATNNIQNRENINHSFGFIVLQTQLASLPVSRNKPVPILNEAIIVLLY